MDISYSLPLSRGWDRMKKSLFQPFDLSKWMRIGFTAWLAGLISMHGSSGGSNSGLKNNNWDDFFRFPDTAWCWLQSHPLWFTLIIAGAVLLIIFGVFLIWVNSRGKFMFLYNVAREKNEIGLPWNEYRKEGNSLFLWQFFFGWITAALFILLLIYCFVSVKGLYYGDFPGFIIFWKIAGMVLMFIVYLIAIGYISLFLNDFVVPLMYKYRLGVIGGWKKFLSLFGRYFFRFVVYGLFILGLRIATGIVVLAFALCTCCIGLLLLAIPYIGSVVLLPVSYTFRALSIEFLAQFGDEFNVLPEASEATDPVVL